MNVQEDTRSRPQAHPDGPEGYLAFGLSLKGSFDFGLSIDVGTSAKRRDRLLGIAHRRPTPGSMYCPPLWREVANRKCKRSEAVHQVEIWTGSEVSERMAQCRSEMVLLSS